MGLIERIFDLPISKRVAERLAADGSRDVEAYDRQHSPPYAAQEADTLAGKPRTGNKVSAPRPEPVAKELRVTLEGKDQAFDYLQQDLAKRDGAHFRDRVALTDGDPALQSRVLQRLPEYTLVLDVVHVAGYVRDACAAILGERYPYTFRTSWHAGSTRSSPAESMT